GDVRRELVLANSIRPGTARPSLAAGRHGRDRGARRGAARGAPEGVTRHGAAGSGRAGRAGAAPRGAGGAGGLAAPTSAGSGGTAARPSSGKGGAHRGPGAVALCALAARLLWRGVEADRPRGEAARPGSAADDQG